MEQPSIDQVEKLLNDEESASAITKRSEYNERVTARKQLYTSLAQENKRIAALIQRYKSLPQLPEEQHVLWAEEMLALPELAIVVLDTTGTREDADIVRICIGDVDGAITHDWLFQPQRQVGQANTTYTGIRRDAIMAASPLEHLWHDVSAALTGRHVIAYNYPFVEKRLKENALHYKLDPIALDGEDVMAHTTAYFRTDANLRLQLACQRIGTSLPAQADAPTRVQGILALLRAMREGYHDYQ